MEEQICKKYQGVTYRMMKTCGHNRICEAVEVEDGIDTVEFGKGLDKVIINNLDKLSFPDVTTIKIGKNIHHIRIPNSLFPNVRNIVSEAEKYPSGTMLKKAYFGISILLNSFCLSPDETLDLKGITEIEEHALDDCAAGKVIHTEWIKNVSPVSLFKSKMQCVKKPEYIGGIAKFGTIVFDIDVSNEVKQYIIPKDVTYICNEINFKKYIPMVVKRNFSFFNNIPFYPPDDIIFEGTDEISEHDIRRLRNHRIKFMNNCEYQIVDDIVYSSDMTTLISCNWRKKGDIKIPEGVIRIESRAFNVCDEITSVTLPDSLEIIGESAFAHCSKLKSVKFGKRIKAIHSFAFQSDIALEEMEIPGSIQAIQRCTFVDCISLKKVILNEGVEAIGYRAFDKTALDEIYLPSTIHVLSTGCLLNASNIFLNSEEVPKDFIMTLYYEDNAYYGGQDLYKSIKLNISGHKMLLPYCITMTEKLKMNQKVSEHGILAMESFYQYCQCTEQKLIIAFAEYLETKSKAVKKYLKRSGKLFVNLMLKNKDEENLVRFLSLNFMSPKMTREVYDMVMDAEGMDAAKMYMVNIMETKKKNCRFAL